LGQPKVVICGSFRKDPAGIRRLFRELETNGCRILSPLTLDFTDTSSEFVTAQNDATYSVQELERFHLRTIKEADFVMLHAPEGYIGTSASFELGYATALGIPVYSKVLPADAMLQTQLKTASSVFEILETIT
jgi:nucleoside 2-deoxyribosyltransferase